MTNGSFFAQNTTDGIILGRRAANASISGKVLNQYGQTVSRAMVEMIDQNGERKITISNTFGNYNFEEMPSGQL